MTNKGSSGVAPATDRVHESARARTDTTEYWRSIRRTSRGTIPRTSWGGHFLNNWEEHSPNNVKVQFSDIVMVLLWATGRRAYEHREVFPPTMQAPRVEISLCECLLAKCQLNDARFAARRRHPQCSRCYQLCEKVYNGNLRRANNGTGMPTDNLPQACRQYQFTVAGQPWSFFIGLVAMMRPPTARRPEIGNFVWHPGRVVKQAFGTTPSLTRLARRLVNSSLSLAIS